MLNEVAKLVQNYLSGFNVYHLGVIGWWDTYAVVRPKPNQQLAGKVIEDNRATPQITAKMNQISPEALHRLSYLGFPRQRAVLTVTDGEIMHNHITGGSGYGGFADRKNHGMNLDIQGNALNALIHEHAHMFWFNMSKPAKTIFQSWYVQMVEKSKPGYVTQNAKLGEPDRESVKSDFIAKRAVNFAHNVIEDLSHSTHGAAPHHYFDLRTALESGDSQALIRRALLTNHGQRCKGTLVKPLYLSSYSYGGQEVPAGAEVELEYVGNKYIINYYPAGDKYRRLEWQKPLDDNQVTEMVTIDSKKLTPEQKTKYKKNVALAKKSPVSFFASPEMKDRVDATFAEQFGKWLNDSWNRDNPQFTAKVRSAEIFSSFQAKLRMRKDKIQKLDDVINVLVEVVKAKFWPGGIDFADDKSRQKYGVQKSKAAFDGTGKPEGGGFRDYMHQQHKLPSAYSAANVDELWAETVSSAAMNLKSVNPELRSMLMKVLRMR